MKFELEQGKDVSTAVNSSTRESIRKALVQISKESLKNFDHFSEGIPNDFSVQISQEKY